MSGAGSGGGRVHAAAPWTIAVSAVLAVLLGGCGSIAGPGSTSDRALPPRSLVVASPPIPARSWTAQDPADRPTRIDVVVGGDLLIHQAVWESAASNAGGSGYDFGPMFDPVRSFVADADLALCHLEVPLSVDDGDLSTYPVFNAPFELADAIADAGFDGCSVASNHTLDQGTAGIDATLGHLDRVGLAHAGAARSADEAASGARIQVHGRQVAHLSYSYGFNGFRIPADEPWRTNLIDPDRIVADALREREAGADLVLVSLHFGTEYVAQPSAYQRDVAAAVTASGAVDLVIGHHAHVVQPVDVVNDTPVIYGLGNLLSNMHQPERRDGVLVRVIFEVERGVEPTLVGIEALPTEVDRHGGHRIALASSASWDRTMASLNALAPIVAAAPTAGAGPP